MTIKVTYNVTDVYVSETISATYINISYEAPNSGGGEWGSITGTLSNQTDLQNALNAKFDDPTGTTSQYLRGDGSLATFPSLTGYVPYTGATTNVDLGEYELKAGQMTLDTSPTGTAAVGTTRWNDTIGSSETTLKGGSVILKNGVDLVARVVNKVSPNQTLTKAAYQAVRVSGAQGQRLAIALAQANNDNNSADTIGLVTETIATNQEGFIITVGQLENINTTGSLQGETWADGDVIYLSPTTAGVLTNIKPVAPNHIIIIGYVEYAHANNGKLYVKVMNGWELGELHDVDTTGATNGQVLKYNGTIWTPSSDVGITSLNGLNATTQTFATGSSGTDFNISSATSTHTFNIPTASGTNRGLLSSADWTTFNSKQNALTNPITGTGTSGQVAYFTGATTQGGNNNLFWDTTNARLGIGTNTPANTLDVTGTARVTGATAFGGNTTLTGAGLMNHQIVSTSTAGYSYMIFKNTGASGREMTLGIGGSTTGNDSNRFFIGDTTAGGAIRMIIDTSGNIGFGTYTPTVISGYTTLAVNNATNGSNIDLMTAGTRVASWNNTSTETYFGTRTNIPLIITTNATEVAKFYANGNFRVGAAAADSGERLQVTGTAKITGATSIGSTLTVTGDASAQAKSLVINFTTGAAGRSGAIILRSAYDTAGSLESWRIAPFGSGGGLTNNANYIAFQSTATEAGGIATSWNTNLVITQAGNVGIGTITPNTSAKLQVDATTQGFLPPRMTTSQKLAITSPATGLQVYDSTLNLMSFYNGSAWVNGGSSNYENYVVQHSSTTYADSTTYYFGAGISAAATTQGLVSGVFSRNGTIRSIYLFLRSLSSPTSEPITLTLFKSTGAAGSFTSVATTTFAFTGSRITVNLTGLNISVSANDVYELSLAIPAMVTNPSNVILSGQIEVEY